MSQSDNKEFRAVKLDETESTNLYIKSLALEEPLDEFTVVYTDFQTKGRGQIGNTWVSNRGENLLFSMLVYPYFISPSSQFILSQIVSISIANVLSRYVSDIKIKWPNDIYWKNSKIAGILIENSLMGQAIEKSIIGIGININQILFPEFVVKPTSLSKITGNKYLADDILSQFMVEFISLYDSIRGGQVEHIVSEYMSCLYRYGDDGYYLYEDEKGQFYAKIVEVKPSGHLVLHLQNENDTRLYAFKEVRFIIE